MTDAPAKRLSLPRVLAFSSLSIPLAGVGLPVGVYLAPLYAREVGLGLELTGLLFMLLRFWDIFTDPLMGYLVDRYRSPWGRVRHWVVLSVPILGLATFFVYMPDVGESPAYFVGWMILFYVGFTLLQTARSAWVPAIAVDYDDRSRFFQWAEIVSVLSMLFLLAIPVVLELAGFGVGRMGQVAVMGWVLLIALPISAFLACTFVRDEPVRGDKGNTEKFRLRPFIAALRNKYLGHILLLELLSGTAIAVTSANYLFVAEFVFGLSDGMSSLILMFFFVMAVCALPLWLKLAERTEKSFAFKAAALLSCSSFFIYYLAGQVGGFWPLFIGAFFNGAAFSAPMVLARSMTADVVEWQVSRTGENRSGIYYSLITSAYKVGSSLALGVGYLILGQWAGFHPNEDNSPEAIHGLLLVFCLLPGTLYLLAAFAASRYPFTRAMQQEVAKSLDPRGPEIMD
ncbi:MFS transporter [Hyphomonas sp.]|uniref:MFS transporter n=1 Tax=Hyphomonas sp. TaxID=87 RepID=UPI0025C59C2F|nr:MFS transporter [Hyphomonas sp.]